MKAHKSWSFRSPTARIIAFLIAAAAASPSEGQPELFCCRADGSCVPVAGGCGTCECNSVPGTCAVGTCDNCPSLTPGACCFGDGSCERVLNATCCTEAGGEYKGNLTTCESNTCTPPTGACCGLGITATAGGLEAPGCMNTTSSDCAVLGGNYQGDGINCDQCPQACCVPVDCVVAGCAVAGGEVACSDLKADDCFAQGGTAQGPGTQCFFGAVAEGLDKGGACARAACCFDDGSCSEITVSACFGQGGTSQSPGSLCKATECPLETGACCSELSVAGHFSVCEDNVSATGCDEKFTSFYPGQTCDEIECGRPPTGACCVGNNHFQVAGFEDGCVDVTEERCSGGKGLGGEYQGDGTSCDAQACVRRLSVSEKGSILYFSSLEVAFSPAASTTAGPGVALSKDTFITLVNDLNREVCVEWHFINGDDPLAAIPGIERAHPGWNSYDCVTCLTPHENVFLSLARGDGSLGCQPLTGLDPGPPPGRPDPDGLPGDRIIRGYAIAFAVDIDGNPISWNHLSGHATVVDYRNRSAWEYNTYAFQCVADPVAGNPCGADPTTLSLDGLEYVLAWDRLLFDFYAVTSTAFSRLSPATAVTLDTELTLYPVSVDLRPNSTNTTGPVLTRTDIVIWNENEDGRTGTSRCIDCWDQTLLSDYDAPNNFLLELLNTNKGYARIDGVRADSCDGPGSCCCRQQCSITADDCENSGDCPPFGAAPGIPQTCGLFNCFDPDCDVTDFRRGTPDRDCSENAALLGLSDKILTFLGAAPRRTDAAMTLVGIGTQEAAIRRNVITPTAPLKEDKRAPREGSR